MKRLSRVTAALAAASGLWLGGCAAPSQMSGDVVRIGFITDMSGPYAEIDGPSGAEAIRMAVADLGGSVAGKRIEVLTADHKNDVNLAVATAREWFDKQGLDVLIGGVNSGTSLAMLKLADEKKKPFIAVGSGNTAHTNEQCSRYAIHYAYDTYSQGKVLGQGAVKAGAASWFFLTADYAFGTQLQDAALAGVRQGGGTIVGTARHPLSTKDFRPFLQQAQGGKAQVLGLASGHTDMINAVKAARQMGLTPGVKLAGTFVFLHELHELGLPAAQGMYISDSWFWTRDADTRAWSQRFFERTRTMPSSLHAGDYSAALQYLNAVKAVGSDDGEKVLAQMRKTRIDDMYAKNGYIREDGRMVHDMYLLQVKAPGRSAGPWDYYDLVDTFRGESAWMPRAESKCALFGAASTQ